MVSFDKLYNQYLGFKYHVLSDNELTVSKLQTVYFYHKYLMNCKLLNKMISNKMLNMERKFSLWKLACYVIG